MAMIAKLVPPNMDKNFSFQMMNASPEQREAVLVAVMTPTVKLAQPFRQSDSNGFLMIEFWVSDREVIQRAANALAACVGIQTLQEGHFTRKDIGFE